MLLSPSPPLRSSPSSAEGYETNFRRQQSYLSAPPLTVLSLNSDWEESTLLT